MPESIIRKGLSSGNKKKVGVTVHQFPIFRIGVNRLVITGISWRTVVVIKKSIQTKCL